MLYVRAVLEGQRRLSAEIQIRRGLTEQTPGQLHYYGLGLPPATGMAPLGKRIWYGDPQRLKELNITYEELSADDHFYLTPTDKAARIDTSGELLGTLWSEPAYILIHTSRWILNSVTRLVTHRQVSRLASLPMEISKPFQESGKNFDRPCAGDPGISIRDRSTRIVYSGSMPTIPELDAQGVSLGLIVERIRQSPGSRRS